jgi:hypothetical protein
MPLAGLMLMKPEQDDGNHELLQMTKLNRWAIVRGKYFVLWAVSSLSLISLLPYVVVRYFLGGVELWQEMFCTLSVIGFAGVVCAGAIGASAYKSIAKRIFVFFLFLGSFSASSVIVGKSCTFVTRGEGITFHVLSSLNALSAVVCYTLLGLGIARSRIRLVIQRYELKPSRSFLLLLFFTPFLCGMSTAFTFGYAGMIGLIIMSFAGLNVDKTFRAKHLPKPLHY